jgi:hypothetical protein
LTPKA